MSVPPSTSLRHRGIYLLPNLITTGAMFAGFYAIVVSMRGDFTAAAVSVFVAALLDGMDGRIARLTGTQSAFGVQYDSLSDLLSFGLAPALVMYAWSLSVLRDYGPLWGKLGWAAAFVYAACTALRLARFNVQADMADKRYFQGLNSPAAASVCMSFVWTLTEFGVSGDRVCFFTPILSAAMGLLMVSRVRYYSFKAWPRQQHVPFIWIIAALMILVLLAVYTAPVLLLASTAYMLSGLVLTLWGIAHRRRGRRAGAPHG